MRPLLRSSPLGLALVGAALFATGCPEKSSDQPDAATTGAQDAAAADAAAEPPDAAAPGEDAGSADTGPVVCDPHAKTAEAAFTDRTAEWGLSSVVGNRIVAADLDGDGYPDLLIHAVYNNARETIGATPKRVWVLMNRPRAGGGREFVDATVDSGVFAIAGNTTQLRSAQLAVAGDVDNDGDLDLFSGTYVDVMSATADPGDRSTVLLNDGTGHFTAAAASAPGTVAQSTSGATWLDYDRDGLLDLFVGFWYSAYGYSYAAYSPELYKGKGDGTFTAVTAGAGLLMDSSASLASMLDGTNARPAYGVTSCDLDDDAWTDLMVSAYGRQWNQLFRNDRLGHFQEKGRTSGYAGDANVDYHDNQMFLCWCVDNPAAAACAGMPGPAMNCKDAGWSPGFDDQPARNNGNTFTTVCADLNGDGKLDLYNAEIHHWWAGQSSDSSELLISKSQSGYVGFDRPGNAATGLAFPHQGLSWNEGGLMAAAADLDNDARPDLVVATSDYPDQFGLVFVQGPDGKFAESGSAMGMHHACMSGLTIADFDRDGDLDAVVGSSTARDCAAIWTKGNEVHLYQSDASTKGSWLALRLAGDPAKGVNKSAIGAKVTVTANGVSQVQELGGGYGHMAMQNDLVLFFGIGSCAQVDSVSVRWPDGKKTTETWSNVGARRLVELRQGDPVAHEVTLQ